MFTPLTHIASAFSFLLSGQLTLPSVSGARVSKPASHRCASTWHDHSSVKASATKRKAAGGHQASRSIQIVTFGP